MQDDRTPDIPESIREDESIVSRVTLKSCVADVWVAVFHTEPETKSWCV